MRTNLIVLLCVFVSVNVFAEPLTITYRAPVSKQDTRFVYPLALLKAAMEATKEQYGDYVLVPSPNMNLHRAKTSDYISKIDNFVFESAASIENERNLLSVKIPIAKGLYGYRLFLIHQESQPRFSDVNSLADLKKLTIGQERTWLDVPVLLDNGFTVVTGGNYEGLFHMLNLGRFDGFSRGVNEAFHELEDRKNTFPNLAVEKTLCLYYPFPRYFYTAKKNKKLAERLQRGLEILISNGRFDQIWRKHHEKFLQQADLKNRKIFRIDNPFLPDTVPLGDPKYWYTPESDN